jgi:RHS repeat-associated protein
MTYKFDENAGTNGEWLRHYKIYDHIGNVRAVVRDEGTGNFSIISQMDYEPFGAVLSQIGDSDRQTFIGKEKDNESSLGDFGVRKYDDFTGRFFQIDPLWEKYYSHTPYHYSANNPVSFLDPGGMDAEVSIKGKDVTINVEIMIYGSGASEAQAQKMQKNIMNGWDKGWKYKDQKTGKTYNVAFDVSVKVLDKSNPTNNPFIIPDSWNPFSRKNYIEIARKKEIDRSFVWLGDEGIWRGWDPDPSSHEFGHLIGLDDQYIEGGGPKKGWQGNIMAEPAGMGIVEQKNIDAIMKHIIYEYKEAGSPKEYDVEINEFFPSW